MIFQDLYNPNVLGRALLEIRSSPQPSLLATFLEIAL